MDRPTSYILVRIKRSATDLCNHKSHLLDKWMIEIYNVNLADVKHITLIIVRLVISVNNHARNPVKRFKMAVCVEETNAKTKIQTIESANCVLVPGMKLHVNCIIHN